MAVSPNMKKGWMKERKKEKRADIKAGLKGKHEREIEFI
jgi:hypothetical protein